MSLLVECPTCQAPEDTWCSEHRARVDGIRWGADFSGDPRWNHSARAQEHDRQRRIRELELAHEREADAPRASGSRRRQPAHDDPKRPTKKEARHFARWMEMVGNSAPTCDQDLYHQDLLFQVRRGSEAASAELLASWRAGLERLKRGGA